MDWWDMQDKTEVPVNGHGLLVRLYWIFVGNIFLLLLLVFIVQKKTSFPSLVDAACLITAASLVIVRYIDIRFLNGQTGEGKPATMSDWRSYAMLIGSIGVGGLLLAHMLVYFLK
jgi:hypothetical protein